MNKDDLLIAISKKLAEEGKLIEAGWISLRLSLPADASEAQLQDMRIAYMAGAQHLFSSIMNVLDPGDEPSDADMKKLDLINEELTAFYREMRLRSQRAKGHA